MNVWIVNPYAVPPSLGGLNRHFYFKKYLEEKGHTVTIFSSSSIYNRNKNLFTKTDKGFYKVINYDGEDFVYVKTTKSKHIISRLNSIHLFCKRVMTIAKKSIFTKPDIVYVSVSPEIEIGVLGNKLSKFFNCPCIIELRDLYPDTLVSFGILRQKSIAFKILSSIFRKTFYKSEALVFTMDGGKQYLIDKKWDNDSGGKIDLKNVYIINNGVDLDAFNAQSKSNFIDDDLDNVNYKNIIYTGSLGTANDIDRILDIAKHIKDPSVKFIIWGDGKKKEDLKKKIINENISNVILKDAVNGNYIPSILKKAFATVVIQKKIHCDTLYGISSNKSFQYFASGKPVILLIDAPFHNFDFYQPGIQIKSSDVLQNVKEIETFLNKLSDKKIYDTYCSNSLEIAKKYDYKTISIQFENILEKTINNYKKT